MGLDLTAKQTTIVIYRFCSITFLFASFINSFSYTTYKIKSYRRVLNFYSTIHSTIALVDWNRHGTFSVSFEMEVVLMESTTWHISLGSKYRRNRGKYDNTNSLQPIWARPTFRTLGVGNWDPFWCPSHPPRMFILVSIFNYNLHGVVWLEILVVLRAQPCSPPSRWTSASAVRVRLASSLDQ